MNISRNKNINLNEKNIPPFCLLLHITVIIETSNK